MVDGLRFLIAVFVVLCDHFLCPSSSLTWSPGSISLLDPLYGGMVATTPNEDVYIFGGFCCGARKSSIYRWQSSIPSSQWITLSSTINTDLYCPGQCSALMPNGYFYIIGAYPQHGKTYIFDTNSDAWVNPLLAVPDMEYPVAYGCVAADTINNKIYVVGGTTPVSSTDYVNYIQVYDIDNNVWSTVSSTIPNAFSLATCHLSSSEGLLYVFGGSSYPTQSYWNTILKYDINTDTVALLSTALTDARYGARVQYVEAQHGVYLIAGYSGSPSKTVEFFDLDSESITTDGIQNLNVLGSYVQTTFVHNQIMVFGGYDTTWLTSSEVSNTIASITTDAVTTTEAPLITTTSEEPLITTTTEQPLITTTTEEPLITTTTEEPLITTTTEQPSITTTTEEPLITTTSVSTTEEKDDITTTLEATTTEIGEDADCISDNSLYRTDCDEGDDAPNNKYSVYVKLSFDVCYLTPYEGRRSFLFENVDKCLQKPLKQYDDTTQLTFYILAYVLSASTETVIVDTNDECITANSFSFECGLYGDEDGMNVFYDYLIGLGDEANEIMDTCNLKYSEEQNGKGFGVISNTIVYIEVRDETGTEIRSSSDPVEGTGDATTYRTSGTSMVALFALLRLL